MPQGEGEPYTTGHAVTDDGSVTFACSTNVEAFPWLALPPRHPVVLQTQNFWTSFGAIKAAGELEDGQWSALVWTDWECGGPDADHAVRGTYSRTQLNNRDGFRISLFDQANREIVTMRGYGVVFRNRNFEEWRSQSKQIAEAETSTSPFNYADPEALGLSAIELPLVGELHSNEGVHLEGLVTFENGLHPNNRVLGGSGDHVNSTHIAEAARQALCLVRRRSDIAITGGEMQLNRYVELGTPFRLEVRETNHNATRFELSQLGKPCTEITLRHTS